MSLTSMLKSNVEDAKELREIISLVEIDIAKISKDIIASPMQAKYILKDWRLSGQVGTAFDYLARFVIKYHQGRIGIRVDNDKYTAEYGLNMLLKYTKNYKNNYKLAYTTGLDIISKYINGDNSQKLFERVIGVSVYFAKLECIYRSGYSEEKESVLKHRIDPYVNQELKNQIKIFEEVFEDKFNIKTVKHDIQYNPSFKRCSIAVGGADADIIIGDTLIDFKSSKYLKSIDEDFKQIIAYLLFNRIIKRPKINKICLYFSRYGKFVEYEFTEKDEHMLKMATSKMEKFIEKLSLARVSDFWMMDEDKI